MLHIFVNVDCWGVLKDADRATGTVHRVRLTTVHLLVTNRVQHIFQLDLKSALSPLDVRMQKHKQQPKTDLWLILAHLIC